MTELTKLRSLPRQRTVLDELPMLTGGTGLKGLPCSSGAGKRSLDKKLEMEFPSGLPKSHQDISRSNPHLRILTRLHKSSRSLEKSGGEGTLIKDLYLVSQDISMSPKPRQIFEWCTMQLNVV